MKIKIRKHFVLNENENRTYQNLAEEVHKGKFISLNAYIRKG